MPWCTPQGGIKAVIYTDTVQWIILLSGLSLVGVPFALKALGGWEAAKVFLNAEMLLSYGFMVSGLMAPVLGFLIYKKPSRNAAIASMISGSLSLLVIQVGKLPLPWELDAVVPALSISLLTLFVMQAYYSNASPDAQSV